MKGTSIQNINYENDDASKIIDDVLKEVKVLDIEKEQYQEQQQYNNINDERNINQETIPKINQEKIHQQIMQQPIQNPNMMYPQQQMIYQQPIVNEQLIRKEPEYIKNNYNNIQHIFMLFIILLLFNNETLKNLLSQISIFRDINGNPNILTIIIITLIILFFYYIYLFLFN